MPRLEDRKWEKVAEHLFRSMLQCDVTQGKRIFTSAGAMAMWVIADRDEFDSCIAPLLEELEGSLKKYERQGRQGEGNMYRYTFLFTKEPEQAFRTRIEDWEE